MASQTDRLIALEIAVAHLQHDLEQMNAVLLAQQAELRSMQELITRLQTQFISLAEQTEGGDIPHEKPPHY